MVKTLDTLEDYKTATASGVVAIDFTATWCGPCKMIGPKFEEFSKTYTNVTCYKLDVDENADAAAEAGISAMPTFFFYKDGVKVDELVGANVAGLEDLFKKYN
eukprot:m.7289 g.7289  ORF g.7289 m.7289 type:complete len:103 (+) comp8787_c0_seq1:116-424(+)